MRALQARQSTSETLPLTRHELRAIKYYLDRFKYEDGWSDATHAEVARLAERCGALAPEADE